MFSHFAQDAKYLHEKGLILIETNLRNKVTKKTKEKRRRRAYGPRTRRQPPSKKMGEPKATTARILDPRVTP